MRIKFRNRNRMIVIAECVWGCWDGFYILPTVHFSNLREDGWTFDIIWLKLYITFGYIKVKDYGKI